MNITEVRTRFVPKFEEQAAIAVQSMFAMNDEKSRQAAEEAFVSDHTNQPFAGAAFVIAEVPGHPELSAEGIISVTGSDWIITTYLKNQVFSDKAMWTQARQETILELSRMMRALPGTVAVSDEERSRVLPLHELSTAQLLDLIDEVRAGNLNLEGITA